MKFGEITVITNSGSRDLVINLTDNGPYSVMLIEEPALKIKNLLQGESVEFENSSQNLNYTISSTSRYFEYARYNEDGTVDAFDKHISFYDPKAIWVYGGQSAVITNPNEEEIEIYTAYRGSNRLEEIGEPALKKSILSQNETTEFINESSDTSYWIKNTTEYYEYARYNEDGTVDTFDKQISTWDSEKLIATAGQRVIITNPYEGEMTTYTAYRGSNRLEEIGEPALKKSILSQNETTEFINESSDTSYWIKNTTEYYEYARYNEDGTVDTFDKQTSTFDSEELIASEGQRVVITNPYETEMTTYTAYKGSNSLNLSSEVALEKVVLVSSDSLEYINEISNFINVRGTRRFNYIVYNLDGVIVRSGYIQSYQILTTEYLERTVISNLSDESLIIYSPNNGYFNPRPI